VRTLEEAGVIDRYAALVNPAKVGLFPLDQRLDLIRDVCAGITTGGRVDVDSFSGLVVDYARQIGAVAIVRGLRSAGLLAFDAFPPAKSAMARLSVGAAGRVPRLARGVPLLREG
jgi:DNA-binding Lrp family transcriptional regulator